MSRIRLFSITLLIIGLCLIQALKVLAGPPFLTDDPVPTDYQHWETYLFAQGEHEHNGYTVNGPAVELNYGGLPDTQFSLTIPVTWVGGEAPHASGLDDLLVGVKYRFLQETNGWPQISAYPQITLPTGDAARGLGLGRVSYELPVWLQKSWGPWTTYGGGGATWISTPGWDNYGFAGWLLQRDLNEHLSLAGEVYAQSQVADDEHAFVALNFGGTYQLTEHFSLLASVGHSIAGQPVMLWYAAIGFDW